MRRSPRFLIVFVQLMILATFAASLFAQARTSAHPVARVNARIDNSTRDVLEGHVLPVLSEAVDNGRLPGDLRMDHMIMVLQASDEQEHALQTLLDQQADKSSPNFHKWVTPDEYGAKFGVDESDIAKVTGWLADQGLTVENVSHSRRFIQFTGSVGQVERAFQTEMHAYTVNGHRHVANSRNISVPKALRPVIAAVPTLNDFFKKPSIVPEGTLAQRRAAAVKEEADADPSSGPFTGKSYFLKPGPVFSLPDYNNGTTTHFVGASDFAVIYNSAPLIALGNDGTGVSIGVIGRTALHLEDIQVYRQMFGLKNNDPQFINAGEAPDIVGGDDGESYLDVEVSGGAAPGASVKFITARATLTTDGVDLAAMWAVENNLTDIISESYGQCENNFIVTPGVLPPNAFFMANLWAQAAAQGQSVFVSSGDNGPAGCDSSNNNNSTQGYAVSLLASTPYNVAVGGTEFNEGAGTYWTPASSGGTPYPWTTATGYIPEVPWNEARTTSFYSGGTGLWSASGGISAFFATPDWQHGSGIGASDPAYPFVGSAVSPVSSPTAALVPGPHRYLPDVSMAAASGHDGTLYCDEGICQLSATGSLVNAGIVGGTSVAAPTMAGVQALVNQYNGGRQGNPNYVYYALANSQYDPVNKPCAANRVGGPSVNCAFRDVTTGNINICRNNSVNGSGCTNRIGWTATDGYDMATGLGSPNAQKLATLWNTVTFNSTTTSFGLSQTTGITHGQSVTASGSVTKSSGPGTPTGKVTFLVSSGALGNPTDPNTGNFLNTPPVATLDGSGNYSLALANLPAGTYTVRARYSGDVNFGASTSAPISVTVSPENATLTIQPNFFNGTTCSTIVPQLTFVYGTYEWTDFTVVGASTKGVPTGTVSITDNGNPVATLALNQNGIAHTLAGIVPSNSCVFGYTFSNVAPPTGGSHVMNATYSGDSSFNSVPATPVTVTITKATVTGALLSGSTNISSGGSVHLTFTLAGLSSAGPGILSPTGTVTFHDNTTNADLGTGSLVGTSTFGAVAMVDTTLITTSGAHSVVAIWPGDTNYNAVTSSASTVTVQSGTATSVVLTANTNPAVLGGRPTFTATMSPTTVTSGTVRFYDNGISLGTGTVGASHTATFQPAASANIPVGVHNMTAVYQGTASFNSSVSPIFQETFTKAATTLQLTAKNNGKYCEVFTMSTILGTTIAATLPSGTVQFLDGANPLGSPQPFTIVTTALGGRGLYQAQQGQLMTVGTHTLTATLTDNNYAAPASNTQTVNVATGTVQATVSGGTALHGKTATLTADLTPGAGCTLPTGSVSFSINGNSVGSAPLVSGVATLNNAPLPNDNTLLPGVHTGAVGISYAGDSNWSSATATGDITITNNPPAIVAGSPSILRGSLPLAGQTVATVSDYDNYDNPPNTYLAVVTTGGLPTGISVTNIAVDGAGNVTATLGADCSAAAGSNSVTFKVTDSLGGNASTSVSINVTNPAAPAITGASPTIARSMPPVNRTIATGVATNAPAGGLTFSTSSVPSGLTVSNIQLSGGVVTADLSASCSLALGSPTFTLTATDCLNQFTNVTVTVNLAAPTLSISNVSPAAPTPSTTAVTITGAGFTNASAVYFGVTPVSFTVVDDSHINTTTPTNAASSTTVSVALSSCDTASASYLYDDAPNTPTDAAGSFGFNSGTQTYAVTGLKLATHPTPPDPNPGDTLTVGVTSIPPHMTLTNVMFDGNGDITGDLTADCSVAVNTPLNVALWVKDNRNVQTNFNVTVKVDSTVAGQLTWVNNPNGPSVDAPATLTGDYQQSFQLVVTLTGIPAPAKLLWNDNTIQYTSMVNGVNTATRVFIGQVGSQQLWVASINDCNSLQTAKFTINVTSGATKLAISTPTPAVVFQQPVTLNATVTSNSGTPDGGTVSFFDNGAVTPFGTAAVSGGAASLVVNPATYALTLGGHTITASYGGGGSLPWLATNAIAPTSVTVSKASTTSALGSSNPSATVGASAPNVVFTATVSAVAPGSASPTAPSGSVTFTDTTASPNVVCTVVVNAASPDVATTSSCNAGSGFYTSAPALGTHTIKAVYAGDGNFNGSNASFSQVFVADPSTTTTLNSSPLSSSTYGSSVTLTAHVSNPAGMTPAGSVSFYDSATLLGTSLLSSSNAVLTTSTLGGGNHSLTAKYNPSGSLTTSTSSPLSFTVSTATPALNMVATPVSTVFGQSVIFKATVSGSPAAPTGTVTFYDGTTAGPVIGSGTIAAGTVSVSTSTLAAGTHTITVVYGGNGNWSTLTIAPSFTVNKGSSTTTLAISPSSANHGQSVTLTATVKAVSPAVGVPTGSVTFCDGAYPCSGGALLGTASVNGSGVAAASLSTLTTAAHTITATYGGSGSFNTSAGSGSITVVKAGTTTSITSATPNPIAKSAAMTVTVTVAPTTAYSGTPTGSVTLKDTTSGATWSGSLSGGVATFNSVTFSTTGAHYLQATYGATTDFNSSSSSSTGVTVTP